MLESVYQINRGLCGAEVMMSLVFGDFFTTGGARIAVVAGVNVSDTDFLLPDSSVVIKPRIAVGDPRDEPNR